MGLPQSPDPKTYYRDQTWDAEYSNLGTATLETKRNRIEERLKKVRKEFKRKVSLNDNSDCWEMTLKVSFLHVKLARVTSQIERRKFDSHERWYNRSEAFNLKLRHDSWTQWESIMRKHESTVRKTTSRESYMRLFATSRVGLERDTSLQSNMAAEMERVYCPDHPKDWESYRWDPVLHDWLDRRIANAAHLFPRSQGAFLDDIFGRGSTDDLFSPCNGLFLHHEIEAALENGYIAIVPDLDLEPADPKFPLDDNDDRQDRVK
ncbi:hypothetical protein ACHAPK_006522 [Fusarium culmorum]